MRDLISGDQVERLPTNPDLGAFIDLVNDGSSDERLGRGREGKEA